MRIIDAFTQFFDDNGEPLVNGYLKFNETGTNNTDKNTYADFDETIANLNPLQLDGAGRCPNVFGTGAYNVISYTSDMVQIQQFDPVGGDQSGGALSDWQGTTNYGEGDIVTADDGKYYRSITSSNQGNDPSTSPDQWEEIRFLGVWSQFVTYSAGDVIMNGEGFLYRSLQDSNLNKSPVTETAWWDGAIKRADNVESLTVLNNSTGNVSRFVEGSNATDGWWANVATLTNISGATNIITLQLEIDSAKGDSSGIGGKTVVTLELRDNYVTGPLGLDSGNSFAEVNSTGSVIPYNGILVIGSATSGQPINVWINTNTAGGGDTINVFEASKTQKSDWTVTYNSNWNWQSATPTGAVEILSKWSLVNGNACRFVTPTPKNPTAAYWTKIAEFTATGSGTARAEKRIRITGTDDSGTTGNKTPYAEISAHFVETVANGLESTLSYIEVFETNTTFINHDSFMLNQGTAAAGEPVELWMQTERANVSYNVYEVGQALSGEVYVDDYNDDTPWQSAAPSGAVTITSDWAETQAIKFPATQIASSDANVLDDYEEGTWTPTVQDDSFSDAEGQTYTNQVGYYTKIGQNVHIEGRITMSSLGTLTTTQQVRIANLPFTVRNTGNAVGAVNIAQASGLAITSGQVITGRTLANTTKCSLNLWDSAVGTTSFLLSELTASGDIFFNIDYTAQD